jgi:hypothetical protein
MDDNVFSWHKVVVFLVTLAASSLVIWLSGRTTPSNPPVPTPVSPRVIYQVETTNGGIDFTIKENR